MNGRMVGMSSDMAITLSVQTVLRPLWNTPVNPIAMSDQSITFIVIQYSFQKSALLSLLAIT